MNRFINRYLLFVMIMNANNIYLAKIYTNEYVIDKIIYLKGDKNYVRRIK